MRVCRLSLSLYLCFRPRWKCVLFAQKKKKKMRSKVCAPFLYLLCSRSHLKKKKQQNTINSSQPYTTYNQHSTHHFDTSANIYYLIFVYLELYCLIRGCRFFLSFHFIFDIYIYLLRASLLLYCDGTQNVGPKKNTIYTLHTTTKQTIALI